MTNQASQLSKQLIGFADSFRVDADVMECRKCKARYHLSHAQHDMRHRDGCGEGELRPWQVYSELIAQVLPASSEGQ